MVLGIQKPLETWTWFMETLEQDSGLWSFTKMDARDRRVHLITSLHRECMRHLAGNVLKKSKGPLFGDDFMACCTYYLPMKHASYIEKICAIV
jgi:hypothetical protein